MPSKPRRSATKKRSASSHSPSPGQVLFFPLLILSFILWVLYRQLFEFPVWFDETLGKAVFFGLPVWLYISVTRNNQMIDTFALIKLRPGVMMGLAIGGIYGFISSLAGMLVYGKQVQAALLFTSDRFWWEFFLALMTGFWETLFFFSLVMIAIKQKFPGWSLLNQVMVTALIFLIFHLPNTVLRFNGAQIVLQLMLLLAFGIGQAFIFAKRENFYTLLLSHAIWGMVLLVHF